MSLVGKSVFLLIAGLACVGAEALASDVSILATYSQSEIREKGDNVPLRASFEWFDDNAVPHAAELELREAPASQKR